MRAAIRSTLAALLVVLAPPAAPGAEAPPPAPAPPPAATAEWRPWSLSLGTGAGGYVEFVDEFAGSGPSGHDASQREHRLQVNARAAREVHPRLRAGVAWVYNRWTEVYTSGATQVGSIDNTVHALMADVTALWIRSEHLELYSGLAAGAGRWSQAGQGIGTSQDGVQYGFAFQLRAIGVAVGNQRLRAFVDLGLGFEGLLVGGLTLRF